MQAAVAEMQAMDALDTTPAKLFVQALEMNPLRAIATPAYEKSKSTVAEILHREMTEEEFIELLQIVAKASKCDSCIDIQRKAEAWIWQQAFSYEDKHGF